METKITQSPEHYYDAYFSKASPIHFFHKTRIDKILELVPKNASVLDAGCGSGVLSFLLAKKGCAVTGVDIRQECINFVGKKCNGWFMQANLLHLSLGKQFDVVVCSDVLEHFADNNRQKVISNLSKHIKQNGELIITFPSKLYLTFEPIWKFTRNILYPNTTFDDEDIHQQIDIAAFKTELKRVGLEVQMIKNNCFGLITYLIAVKA